MNFGVITFPGSNCDDDMHYVLGEVFGHKVRRIWHKETSLHGINPGDCIVLPGGFSYGDYLRCGAIARFSPIMEELIRFASDGGMVIGICNGFQILCEAGLLPGQLLLNRDQLFICDNVWIKPNNNQSALTYDLDVNKTYSIPIAHAEGRYFADALTLDRLHKNNQILFQYCDENGLVNEKSNVNGSSMNIAGICNEKRNVYGMMPHPERASESALGNTDGKEIFKSLFSWMKEHHALLA
ncbi:MAG: phosphoribosylformylglycinamidine synthase subunit PurQ [Saprospiraceae bacterium]|nr:phosphoribosylformylglycinamidine synthase subunit PurQ [Saprospiraceae bacterium]